MNPSQPFSPRHKLVGMFKFIAIVLGVTVVGVIVLINVHALAPSTTSKNEPSNSDALQNQVASGPPPSGQPMPLGDISGWHQVLTDDFPGTKLDSKKWQTYAGPAGGVPNTLWEPSHAVVQNGMLELKNTRVPNNNDKWVSAGVSSAIALHQIYGKYLVRFRIDKGDGITGILLLWPSDNKWPPEIDFAENGGGDRSHMNATLHYSADDQKILRTTQADFSQWHTMGVEWSPGRLQYTLDDTIWASVDSDHVPKVPMALDMQTQAGICGNVTNPCPNASTPAQVSLYVDWAVAYAPQ